MNRRDLALDTRLSALDISAAVAQLAEHFLGKEEVLSSSLNSSFVSKKL